MLNSIGLEVNKADKLAQGLNILLAKFQIYYPNLRVIH